MSLWTPVAAFMALLFCLSAQPSLPTTELVWDKLAHAVGYAVFGLACLRAFHGGVTRPARRPVLFACALALAYALLDELHQAYVPGRYASSLDWVADAVGIGLSIPIFSLCGWSRVGKGGGR